MHDKTAKTFWAKIYISGPIDVIEQVCRKECCKGLCVTVTPTKYIYKGGEETGAEIGLINYPKFPKKPAEIAGRAVMLAFELQDATYQDSALIMTPTFTRWISKREMTNITHDAKE